MTQTPPRARFVCSRCGGRDYSLSVNYPHRPIRAAQTDTGSTCAKIRLPPAPEIDVAGALRRGR